MAIFNQKGSKFEKILSKTISFFQILTVDIKPRITRNNQIIPLTDAEKQRNNARKLVRFLTLAYTVFRANQLYINYTGNVNLSSYNPIVDYSGITTQQLTRDIIGASNNTLLLEDIQKLYQ